MTPATKCKLHAALGASLIYTKGATAPETGAAWTKALEIADSLEDAEYQLRSLWGLWVFNTVGARHRSLWHWRKGFPAWRERATTER